MNAILVPGMPEESEHYDPSRPSNSEDHWFSWLKRQLIVRDIHANSVETPFPFKPRYEDWKKEFERFDIKADTILVGHSCGAGFLIRYLSEHKDLRVGRVVLVAPWTDPDDYEIVDVADFFDFKIDPNFPSKTDGVTVFISSDDEPSVVKTVENLKEEVKGIEYKEYKDQGHFTKGKYKNGFNDLLEVIL